MLLPGHVLPKNEGAGGSQEGKVVHSGPPDPRAQAGHGWGEAGEARGEGKAGLKATSALGTGSAPDSQPHTCTDTLTPALPCTVCRLLLGKA